MTGIGSWKVGDPCFAKVKGFIPYPAKITSLNQTGKKFSVLFYQTNEVNDISRDCIWPINPDTVVKLVTPKTLKKKVFELAFALLKKHHSDIVFLENKELGETSIDVEDLGRVKICQVDEDFEGEETSLEVEVEEDSLLRDSVVPTMEDRLLETSSDDDEYDFNFNYSKKPQTHIAKKSHDVHMELDDVGEAVVEKAWNCDDCGVEVIGNKAFVNHMIDHALQEKDDLNEAKINEQEAVAGDNNLLIDDTEPNPTKKLKPTRPSINRNKKNSEKPAGNNRQESVKKPSKSTPSKVQKNVKVKTRKIKSLRESEMELNDAFKNKIVCKSDETFHCRSCPLFVTSVKLLARSHAQNCGVTKKLGRKAKMLKCGECGETLVGKKIMRKHVQEMHLLPSYQCSVCGRKFKRRVHYRRHLQIHDQEKRVACPFCPKLFKFESYKVRHVTRVHKTRLNANVDLEVVIKINQKEVKCGGNYFWEFEACFPATENTSSSFNNSLELPSVDDWTAWILVSQLLGLPVAADGTKNGFEIAVIEEENRDDRIICVGSNIELDEDPVKTGGDVQLGVQAIGGQAVVVELVGQAGVQEVVGQAGVGEPAGGQVGCVVLGVQTGVGGDHGVQGFDGEIEGQVGGGEVAGQAYGGDEDVNVIQVDSVSALKVGGLIEGFLDNLSSRGIFSLEDKAEQRQVPPVDLPSEEDSVLDAAFKKSPAVSLLCQFCGSSGFQSGWFLRRHISLMHLGSVKCKICALVFIDKFHYLQHAKTCFFWCDQVGCSFHEKRKARLESHKRGHDRDY